MCARGDGYAFRRQDLCQNVDAGDARHEYAHVNERVLHGYARVRDLHSNGAKPLRP